MKRTLVCCFVVAATMCSLSARAQSYLLDVAPGVWYGDEGPLVSFEADFYVSKIMSLGPYFVTDFDGADGYGISLKAGSDPSRNVRFYGDLKILFGPAEEESVVGPSKVYTATQLATGAGIQYNFTRGVGVRLGATYVFGNTDTWIESIMATAGFSFKLIRKN